MRRESNTPGKCSFHEKAAVGVDTATTAITITAHAWQMLAQLTLPTPPLATAAEIAMRKINTEDVAVAKVSRKIEYTLKSGSVTEWGVWRNDGRGWWQA